MARSGSRNMLIFIVGNIVFSIIGLIIGYFLLVQIRPEMDFLNLNLPQVADMKGPQMPEWWPTYDWDPTQPYVDTGAVNAMPADVPVTIPAT